MGVCDDRENVGLEKMTINPFLFSLSIDPVSKKVPTVMISPGLFAVHSGRKA